MPSEMGEGCYWPQTCIREAAYADCRVTWRALTHIRDTHVPVEEPSTASKADLALIKSRHLSRYEERTTQYYILSVLV
jgi:hypothetical protein